MPRRHLPRDDTTDVELGQLFDGVVVPEATPSPRTIRFATPPIHAGPGRALRRGHRGRRPAVSRRIFPAFDDVTDLLVGPDFVAVTISRPGRWESLLGPMLHAVTDEFTTERDGEPPPPSPPTTASGDTRSGPGQVRDRPERRLERAWAELGRLRADRPDDLDRLVAAGARR